MNQASDYVAGLRAVHKPWPHGPDPKRNDRAKQLFKLLRPNLPHSLEILYRKHRLEIEEIGDRAPLAFYRTFPDTSHAIVFNSGLMHFLYAVARIMASRIVVHHRDRSPVPSSLPLEETIERLRSLFIKVGQPNALLADRDFALDPAQIEIAERITKIAEAFILAHELGHIYFNTAHPDTELESEEEYADLFAARQLIRAKEGADGRWPYAGCLFALRVFIYLERTGFPFPSSYPPPSRRLELLDRAMDEACPEAVERESLKRIGAAFDQMLEKVENVATGTQGDPMETEERLSSRLASLIEELVSGRQDRYEVLKTAKAWIDRASPHVARGARSRLQTLFPMSLRDSRQRLKRETVRELGWLAASLPEPARTAFGGPVFYEEGYEQ